MYCHDTRVIYYVVAGDRIFCCPLLAVLAGHARAVADSETSGAGSTLAGRSPFLGDTAVVGLAEMLRAEDGEARDLAPLALDDGVQARLLAGVLRVPAPTLLAAVSTWADYCDEVAGHMDDGAEAEDAFVLAGLVPVARAA